MKKLSFIIVLFHTMLAAGCGKGEPKITKLIYSINLTKQDNEGNYLGKVGEPVIITATATGTKVGKVQWGKVKISPDPSTIMRKFSWSSSKKMGPKSIKESFKYTFPMPITLTMQCTPALGDMEDTQDVQTFKIKIEE